MIFRTDLAIEADILISPETEGISSKSEKVGSVNITRINIENESASKRIGKAKGIYITLEFPALTDHFESTDEKIITISNEIQNLLPKNGLVLVIGLGNSNITPDALGPQAADFVLATRHIQGEIARTTGLDKLRSVAVLAPGVLGQTGVESAELIKSVSDSLKPSVVILIDALASKRLDRLGKTIQISNTGISPGSGVMNSRPGINEETLGVPVISIGIPTVVDAKTLAADVLSFKESKNEDIIDKNISAEAEFMMVTPREIDLLIERASRLTGMAINCALHPDFSPEDLYALVS